MPTQYVQRLILLGNQLLDFSKGGNNSVMAYLVILRSIFNFFQFLFSQINDKFHRKNSSNSI